jgi:hypothetical protein
MQHCNTVFVGCVPSKDNTVSTPETLHIIFTTLEFKTYSLSIALCY